MARIYWDKTGAKRALTGYFARRVSSPANLTPWRGDFAELITVYKDHCYTLQQTRAEYEALSKAEKKQVKDIGGFIGACLKKPHRADENVTGRDFITIDADAAPADFISRWKVRINKAAIIHTTASHTPENPRYRLIIPLDSTLYLDGSKDADKARYKGIVTDLLDLLDLLPYLDADGQRVEPVDMQASADLSRLMFWPCCCIDETPTLEIIEGELLDPARDYPLIRERLKPIEETPPSPLQAEHIKQASGNGNGETQTAQTLEAAFAALAGRTAEAQTPAPIQGQGTPPEVDAETAARKLGASQIADFKTMIATAGTKDAAGQPIRTERNPEIESDNLTKADKGFAQEIFDSRSWRFVPSIRDPKSGDEKFTGVTLRAINATQAEAVAQCYQDCRGHEDLFFNTIYGDFFRHAAGEDFLSKSNIKRYIDTRPIFEYVLSELGVLEKLKSGLLSIARGSTKKHKTKRSYMPVLAEILAGEDAIEELNIEWQDEITAAETATDGKDGRE